MELRKKSILIALCLGDGYITHQRQLKKGKYYQYNYLEVSHGSSQKDYIEWKANLCTSVTGRKSTVRPKKYKAKEILGVPIEESIGYTFTNTSPYFRILRRWLYPNNKKYLNRKYLEYLDPLGIAIWFMDDGSTYVSKTDRSFSVKFSTHCSEEECKGICEMFKEKFGITFHINKVKTNQYNVRSYSSNALKFLKLIEPFVPDCMAYKLIVPKFYFQECSASHLEKIKGMKIYSEQQ